MWCAPHHRIMGIPQQQPSIAMLGRVAFDIGESWAAILWQVAPQVAKFQKGEQKQGTKNEV